MYTAFLNVHVQVSHIYSCFMRFYLLRSICSNSSANFTHFLQIHRRHNLIKTLHHTPHLLADLRARNMNPSAYTQLIVHTEVQTLCVIKNTGHHWTII